MPTPSPTLRDLLHEALNDLSAGRPQRFVVADLLAALRGDESLGTVELVGSHDCAFGCTPTRLRLGCPIHDRSQNAA